MKHFSSQQTSAGMFHLICLFFYIHTSFLYIMHCCWVCIVFGRDDDRNELKMKSLFLSLHSPGCSSREWTPQPNKSTCSLRSLAHLFPLWLFDTSQQIHFFLLLHTSQRVPKMPPVADWLQYFSVVWSKPVCFTLTALGRCREPGFLFNVYSEQTACGLWGNIYWIWQQKVYIFPLKSYLSALKGREPVWQQEVTFLPTQLYFLC